MRLESIWLRHFRNHEERIVRFHPQTTIILGDNGKGKSNLLESVYLLATGKSFKADKSEEMVMVGKEVSNVKGKVVFLVSKADIFNEDLDKELFGEPVDDEKKKPSGFFEDRVDLEIIVTRGVVQGQKVPRKKFLVNGVSRLQRKFVGVLKVVLFGPSDLRLIEGSPSRRREYLDEVLCQISEEYRRALLAYEQGVRRRNKLLQAIREGEANRKQLFFWNQLLIKNGNILTKQRRDLVDFLNFQFRESKEILSNFEIEYDSSGISSERLEQYAREEVAAGVTLVGPHRDDFSIRFTTSTSLFPIEGADLKSFGSRGEQRMGVLWLKLGQLEYMFRECKERPVLLLDDIFSELDHEHRQWVIEAVGQQQTIITSADGHLLEGIKGEVVEL